MKYSLAFWILGAAAAVACTPGSKNAGDLQDTGDGDGEGDGTAASSDGPGTDGGSGDATSTSAETTVGETSGEATTDGGFPNACVAMGWLDAYETFQQMSEAAGHTYWYRVLGGGEGFFGPECEYRTTIVVESGEVVRRIFEVLGPPPSDPELPCDYEPFVEEKDELGTHNETFWQREPWTLEQLYLGCCEEVLTQPPEENDLTFSTDGQGMMAACSYFPLNCADGCSAGPDEYGYISIDSMGFGPLPPD